MKKLLILLCVHVGLLEAVIIDNKTSVDWAVIQARNWPSGSEVGSILRMSNYGNWLDALYIKQEQKQAISLLQGKDFVIRALVLFPNVSNPKQKPTVFDGILLMIPVSVLKGSVLASEEEDRDNHIRIELTENDQFLIIKFFYKSDLVNSTQLHKKYYMPVAAAGAGPGVERKRDVAAVGAGAEPTLAELQKQVTELRKKMDEADALAKQLAEENRQLKARLRGEENVAAAAEGLL